MTDQLNYPDRQAQFDIGRVINRTFRAIKNNFVSFFLAALIVMGLPMFLIGLWPAFMGDGGIADNGSVNSFFLTGIVVISFSIALVAVICSVLLQGTLIFGAIEDFNGRKAKLGDCISIALRHFSPLLGLAILIVIGTLLGFLALIIPGIILTLGWMIAAPVLLVEGKGITDAMTRSWELTSGYKWWLFLLMIIYLVFSGIIETIFGMINFTFFGNQATFLFEGGPTIFYFLNALLTALSQTVTTMVSATGVAAVYYEIRQIKEGIGADSLAAVFD